MNKSKSRAYPDPAGSPGGGGRADQEGERRAGRCPLKLYRCDRWPFLSVGERVHFQAGQFATDDPGLQEQIESLAYFGVHVWEVKTKIPLALRARIPGTVSCPDKGEPPPVGALACKTCRKRFSSARPWARFCSTACRMVHHGRLKADGPIEKQSKKSNHEN